MKKIALALGTIALLSIATLSAPASAQPYPDRAYVVPAPPPPSRGYIVTPGYAYVQPGYVQRGPGYDGRHHRGYGDRDHDGIPNRYDRDRDGDGVPNRYDSRPDNPYRY
ncbi:thrombospondin type 3 repeat-containing protein [Variovorax sp. GT1P44]|uniref:thrombospondin type 3 repeat-containing protein n=1 Tax=Variovorax sp. GT1P44 TaxID=3443742 RepID=UPI003F468EF7